MNTMYRNENFEGTAMRLAVAQHDHEWRWSAHAKKRVQQRGIPTFIVDLLVRFGDREADKHGARLLYFGKRARKRVRSYLGREIFGRLGEYMGVYAVIADGNIVTCGHRTKRIRRH